MRARSRHIAALLEELAQIDVRRAAVRVRAQGQFILGDGVVGAPLLREKLAEVDARFG